MEDQTFVSGGVGRERRSREQRRRRRRARRLWALSAGIVVLALVVGAAVVVHNRSGDENAGKGRVGTGAATSTVSTTTVPVPPTDPASVTTYTGVKLAVADLTKDPVGPVGHFRDNKLLLEGSVPDVGVADGYLRKATGILGQASVVMRAKLDPRAPAGPARVIIDEQFSLPSGSGPIDARFRTLLGVGKLVLEKVPESRLVLDAYTDNVGSSAENRRKTQDLVQQVVDYLVSQGLSRTRVVGIGHGEEDPIATNATKAGRKLNRRVSATFEGVMP